MFSLIHFSLLIDSVAFGAEGTMKQRSPSSHFCGRQLWAILARPGMSTLWRSPVSISFADHCIATLQGVLKDGLGEAVVARYMLNQASFRLFTVGSLSLENWSAVWQAWRKTSKQKNHTLSMSNKICAKCKEKSKFELCFTKIIRYPES